MDLSDADGGRGRRRKRYMGRGAFRENETAKYERRPPIQAGLSRAPVTPVILAKPYHDQQGGNGSGDGKSSVADRVAPVVTIKQREDPSKPDGGKQPAVSGSGPILMTKPSGGSDASAQPSYQLQRKPRTASSSANESIGGAQSKPAVLPDMTRSIKLVDESWNWCEHASEMLLDQTDFLVVGILGLQGCGKSTIMSLLAGNKLTDDYRKFSFRQQSLDVRERSGYQTEGVDFFVTPERMILLDTQPVLSAATLEHLIGKERTFPGEVTSAENYMEMQSLHLASFLFSVCHAVVVAQDWFADFDFLKFLLRAEMLKPGTQLSSSDGSNDDIHDYFPTILFVQNRAEREDFSPPNLEAMERTILAVFKASKLKYKGVSSLPKTRILSPSRNSEASNMVNLFLLPEIPNPGKGEEEPGDGLVSGYRGYPSTRLLVKTFRHQVYSLPRPQLTHHSHLTEKNWFHYSARMWESIKKSTLMSEFNRVF